MIDGGECGYLYDSPEYLMPIKKTTKKNTKTEDTEFAVILAGGKQYKVSVGDLVRVEKIKGDFKKGDEIIFDKVLLVDNGKDTSIGTPYIEKAEVHAILEKIGRAQKIDVVKYKSKSRYHKKNGHRQPYFEVKIKSIN